MLRSRLLRGRTTPIIKRIPINYYNSGFSRLLDTFGVLAQINGDPHPWGVQVRTHF